MAGTASRLDQCVNGPHMPNLKGEEAQYHPVHASNLRLRAASINIKNAFNFKTGDIPMGSESNSRALAVAPQRDCTTEDTWRR